MKPRPSTATSRQLPALAAVAVVGAILATGATGAISSARGSSAPPIANAPAAEPIVQAAAGTTPKPQRVEAEAEPKRARTTLSKPLGLGSAGTDVERLQERLAELGFHPGPVDGQFGQLTQAAVWAFEKLVLQIPRDQATGVVTDELWQFMQQPIDIQPRRKHAEGQATTNHTEIYLPEQVVAWFIDDEPVLISHMSSGDGKEWREEVTISPGEWGNEDGTEPLVRGEIGVSVTPGGVFTYDRMVDGLRESALGTLWNPAYFNYGIAVHGANHVPLQPVSHGCVRVPRAVGDIFQEHMALGDQVFVWDGIKEPEEYGAQLPIFNRVDPDWVPSSTAAADSA